MLRFPTRPASRLLLACAFGLACGSLASCYPTTRMQTPRTTPKGKVHGALGFAVGSAEASTVGFTPDVALRIGIHERADLGVRVRSFAVEASAKVQLLRDDVELSIAPALLYAADDDLQFEESDSVGDRTDVRAGRASVYVGSDADAPFSFFVAPSVDIGERVYDTASEQAQALLLAPGALAGVVFAPNPSTRLLLELGWLVPVGGVGKVALEQTRLGPGDPRFEVNLALLFGSYGD
jgi:hypothetical protein